MSEALRLFGSRAIVTGASNGIGEAIVRTLVKQGGSVFAVDKPGSGIETHFKKLRNVTPYAASVADKDSAIEMVRQANEALDGLDIVVNNSSIKAGAVMSDNDETELSNFWRGRFSCTQRLRAQRFLSWRKVRLDASSTWDAIGVHSPGMEKQPTGNRKMPLPS